MKTGPGVKRRTTIARYERAERSLCRALDHYRDMAAIERIVCESVKTSEGLPRAARAHADTVWAAITLARTVDGTAHLLLAALRGDDLRTVA